MALLTMRHTRWSDFERFAHKFVFCVHFPKVAIIGAFCNASRDRRVMTDLFAHVAVPLVNGDILEGLALNV